MKCTQSKLNNSSITPYFSNIMLSRTDMSFQDLYKNSMGIIESRRFSSTHWHRETFRSPLTSEVS